MTLDFTTALISHANTKPFSTIATTAFIFYQIHGRATIPTPNSSFLHRTPHIMLEIIGLTFFEDTAELLDSFQWTDSLADNVVKKELVGSGVYMALSEPGDGVAEKCFGSSWEKLKEFKS